MGSEILVAFVFISIFSAVAYRRMHPGSLWPFLNILMNKIPRNDEDGRLDNSHKTKTVCFSSKEVSLLLVHSFCQAKKTYRVTQRLLFCPAPYLDMKFSVAYMSSWPLSCCLFKTWLNFVQACPPPVNNSFLFTHYLGNHRYPSLTPVLLDLTMRLAHFFPGVEMACQKQWGRMARLTLTVHKGQDAGVCPPSEPQCFRKVTSPQPYIIQMNLRPGKPKGKW